MAEVNVSIEVGSSFDATKDTPVTIPFTIKAPAPRATSEQSALSAIPTAEGSVYTSIEIDTSRWTEITAVEVK